ncbi:hypothetical protein EEJ42_16430, partial [Streptomyces botrytidirepellens]
MGLFDRLRGQSRAPRGGVAADAPGETSGRAPGEDARPDARPASAVGMPGGPSASGSASGAGSAGDRTDRRAADAWAGIPPIQSTAAARPPRGVADPAFGGSLTTWQNPSFTGTLSHAVLDGAPGGLIRGALSTSGSPSPDLGAPSLALPMARPEPPPTETPSSGGSPGPLVRPVPPTPARRPTLT